MNQKKEILVNINSLWSDIQSVFSGYYPFLKMEMIKKGSPEHRITILASRTCLTHITANEPCIIDINNNRTVLEIMNDFKTKLGLEILVSRKSGNVWNIISITEEWTLKSQNAAGEFISSQPPISIIKGNKT